jgi:hypothetical protein
VSILSRRLAGIVSIVVAAVSCVACAATSEKPSSPIRAAFESFDQFQATVIRNDLTTRAAASKIHDRYRALFSRYQKSTAVKKLNNDDVALLFRAADSAHFYTISADPLADMQLDLAELRRRGIAQNANFEKVYTALIESRSFDKARALSKLHRFTSVEAVPEVADNVVREGPTTLLVEQGGKKLERKSVDLSKGLIVVVSSPLCHFCQRAIGSINRDARLRALFHAHALWMVPPDESTSFEAVANWNRIHPSETMQVAYRREEWPMIERWETPVFYFFRGGRVVSIVSGWPMAGRKAEINRSLKLVGLE